MDIRKLINGLGSVTLLLGMVLNLFDCGGSLSKATEEQAMGKIFQYGEGYRFDKNGWITMHIQGEPYDRGYQHGFLVASELKEILRSLKYLTFQDTGMQWDYFVKEAERQFVPYIDQEYLDEIKGIADGAQAAGTQISWQEVLTWNGYDELTGYWWPNELEGKYAKPDNDHCSGFIATGSATKDGKVVMAHNSWTGPSPSPSVIACGGFASRWTRH